MKTFALAILILSLGTVALRSFTHAGSTTKKQDTVASSLIDIEQLTNDDLAKLQSDILDHSDRLENHNIRLRAIDSKLLELQTKLTDCNKLSIESAQKLGAFTTKASDTRGGGSTGTATRNIYQPAAAPKPAASGGSTGNATANIYQPSSVVYSAQPTVTYIEQPVQYTVQQSAPVRDTGFLSRTVTNSSSVASPQECYIDANGNSVCPSSVQSSQNSRTTTFSRPRLFRR